MGNAQLTQFAQFMSVIAAFTQAMREHGIETEAFIQADGQFHRCRVNGDKAGSSSGWYLLHLDGVPVGAFGCWKRGVNELWCAKPASTMTDIELQALTARIEAIKHEQEAAPAFHAGADGTDFNDLHQQQGIDAVRAAVEVAAAPGVQHEAVAPDHIAETNNMTSDAAGGEWPAVCRHAALPGEASNIKSLSVALVQPKGSDKYGE